MNWINFNDINQLTHLKTKSFEQPQVIFKHSTRCSISGMVKSRLERAGAPADIPFYYLDLISNRNISNKVAEDFFVEHESPQVLIIKNGECVYDESHNGINMEDILGQAA